MAKQRKIFVCRECGHELHKWMGRCPACQSWNSMEEESVREPAPPNLARLRKPVEPVGLPDIEMGEGGRLQTGMAELDRTLGGGAVPGTTILVGGDPGIGKSTLMLQAALRYAARGEKALYVTGEESLQQVKMRADRLGLSQVPLLVLAETEYNRIAQHISRERPAVVVIDSIQTAMKSELGNVPGSLIQIREVTASLVQLAKTEGVTFFIVGHVTKEGTLAGPRLLEHMVDCVLYFEGERYQSFRILRGVKNRFGSTNEMGIFTMDEKGLLEVNNPSALFLNQRPQENVPGSVVVPVMEGTRPLLVELQGLVTPLYVGGSPRRTSTGLDYNRVVLVIAVLEKRVGLQLYSADIFVNAVGGVRIAEPAADLGVALSLASSSREKPLLPQTLVLGEIGLTGEVRPVGRVEERLKEGSKMGFVRCIMPRGNLEGSYFSSRDQLEKDLELVGVSTLHQALKEAFN